MAGSRKISVEILGDSRSLEKAFGRSEKAGHGFASSLGKVGKFAAFGVGGAALGGLAVVLKTGASEFSDSSKQAAQMAAALKSTGGVANVTAKELNALADAQLRKTGIDDEATKASENMLLTFTDIRNVQGKNNDIFNQTEKAVADVATRMNNGAIPSAEQLSKTSIQLGKALNDPVKGVGALKKIGVTFTDQQKKMIEGFEKTGQKAKAQKVILKELTKEFGGSAKAAGDTLPGQLTKLREQFNNLAGDIFAKLVPALTKVVKWTTDHWPEISKVFDETAKAIGVAIQFAVKMIRPVVDYIKQHWPEISQAIENTARTIKAVWVALWPTVSKVVLVAMKAIIPTIRNLARIIKGVVQVISAILHGDWRLAWKGVVNIVSGIGNQLLNVLNTWIKLVGIVGGKIAGAFRRAIVGGLKGLGGLVAAAAIAPINAAIALVNAFKFNVGWGAKKIRGHTVLPGVHFTVDPIPVDIPSIPVPKLAEGGLISSPTLAMLGERGPEAVIPLGALGLGGVTIMGDVILPGVRNPQQFVKELQAETLRRSPPARRGRFAGAHPVAG